MKTKIAFTLIELLVVIAILSLLVVVTLPALASTKHKSKTARCASNMRLWGAATSMYSADNHDALPYFGQSGNDFYGKTWIDYLSPYVARITEPGGWYTNNGGGATPLESYMFTNEVRRCPTGTVGATGGFAGSTPWIGANFGLGSLVASNLTGIFYYASQGPPLPQSRIRKPFDCLAFMDVHSYWVYNPNQWRFDFTYAADSPWRDSSSSVQMPFNYAVPKAHEGGCNVTLLDGHVERVPYRILWANTSGIMVHSYWYPED